jgi:superfamily II DNA or RNA helicase
MIPSIAERNYDKIFNDIGLLIVDECHHIASKIFSKCLYKIGADYTIGLSATPKRKDGLTKIIHWYLGPQLIYIKNRDKNINTLIYNIKYECNDNKFKILTRRYKGKDTINTVDMITNLTKINDRNILILNIIKKLLDDNDRYIMVLSERIDHLELLKNNIDNFIKVNKLNILTEYYKGSSSKDERRNAENNNNIHILFGSYQIASEGLDIPRLNTLILASPKKDVEQCIGRIQRKIHNINPLVIDILDQIKPFQNYLNNKKKLYKLNKYVFIDFINNINNKFNLDNLNNININNFIDNNSCNDNDEIDNDDNNNNNNYIDF